MTTAAGIAAAFEAKLTQATPSKLSQGLCSVANGRPLFGEGITATKTSVVVDLSAAEPAHL